MVLREARQFLQFLRRQGPWGAWGKQASHHVQVGDGTERARHIVAVQGQRQCLAHPFVVKWLLVHINDHAEMARLSSICNYDFVAQLLLDAFCLAGTEETKFHIGANRPDRLGACPVVCDDEILHAIQVRQPRLPVVRVALEFDRRPVYVRF